MAILKCCLPGVPTQRMGRSAAVVDDHSYVLTAKINGAFHGQGGSCYNGSFTMDNPSKIDDFWVPL